MLDHLRLGILAMLQPGVEKGSLADLVDDALLDGSKDQQLRQLLSGVVQT
jgi:hypothetical protein